MVVVLMCVLPVASATPHGGECTDDRTAPHIVPPDAVHVELDALSTIVEVGPGETRVLRVDGDSLTLEPQDWYDPVRGLTGNAGRAVERVAPWLKRDLAIQLRRLEGNADRFAKVIVDCSEDDWVDEIAFSVAHMPPEELLQVGDASVLQDNARHLYSQDQYIAYADIVERTGEDGNYTTVRYLNWTGQWNEYPREIYYWYLAHARVFWEAPARVAGKSFWRKAYFDEISYADSGTLKTALSTPTNIIEGINASTVWMQMNMEFGYGTNPLQPVQVILERYGSCGQYSITTAASLKVAMVPARVAIYPASDHQWCEVWHDGHWRHIDASNDVAGNANVKEPELIRRTNSVNYNDAGVFERGSRPWKPYMSAMSTFRSDDVIINSIDIAPPGPSFSMRESGMTETAHPEPHRYTNTSTVHITVEDADGDPIEAAYVAIFRVGHYVYDASQKDYPHFAYANYTDADGRVDFELGLQGYCARCGKDHTYAALILSGHNQATNDFYEVRVPEENTEYSYTFQATGNAPHQTAATWSPYTPQPIRADPYKLGLEMEVWGLQRHLHGEYGPYETFSFRTTFDHVFPASIDVLVTDEAGLETYTEGGLTPVHAAHRDVQRLSDEMTFEEGNDTFILLSNMDSSHTTKVVNITVNVYGLAYPRFSLDAPEGGTDHSTAEPLTVTGNLWDRVPVTALEWSLDNGSTWSDLLPSYNSEDRNFSTKVDPSNRPSGDHQLLVRATDDQGIWRIANVSLFLDADDPEVEVVSPVEDETFMSVELVDIEVDAVDNRALVDVRVRMAGGPWQVMEGAAGAGRFTKGLPLGDEVGPVTFEVEAVDGVGRTTLVGVTVFSDGTVPKLELDAPEPMVQTVVGAKDDIEVTGYAWDDHGLSSLRYSVGEGDPVDVTSYMDTQGEFSFSLPVSSWVEGEHEVLFEVEDLAGHTTSLRATVVRDATAPELYWYLLDPVYEDDDEVELEGSVTDEHGVAGLWVTVDDGEEEELSIGPLGAFMAPLPSGAKAVGGHTVQVRSVDVLGNDVARVITYEVVDLTDPEVEVQSPTIGTEVPRGSDLTISGTARDNIAVTDLWLRVGTTEDVSILGDLDRWRGTWTTTVTTDGMDLGGLSISLWAQDAAGNRGTTSAIHVIVVDGSPPRITMATPGTSIPEGVEGGELVVPLEFSDDVGVVRLEYRVDGLGWVPVLCPLPCDEWLLTVPLEYVPAGSHLLEARVTDARGNEAVMATPFTVHPPPEDGLSTVAIAGMAGAVLLAIILVLLYFLRSRARPPEDHGEPGSPPAGEMSEEEADRGEGDEVGHGAGPDEGPSEEGPPGDEDGPEGSDGG